MFATSSDVAGDTSAAQETNATHETSAIRIVDESALEPQETFSVKEYVKTYFSDVPILARVAWCESKFTHTEEDGSVLRGSVTPNDVGVMQINTHYHGKTAQKLGIDLHTIDGNLAYARYLYEKKGMTPWNASRHCWSDAHVARK